MNVYPVINHKSITRLYITGTIKLINFVNIITENLLILISKNIPGDQIHIYFLCNNNNITQERFELSNIIMKILCLNLT